jgi:putative tryptophan/tyrosine transport system substrate-binding protein
MIARRAALVGAGSVLLGTRHQLSAQTSRPARVGWLSSYPAQAEAVRKRSLGLFFDRMHQLGWKQGDNLILEIRGRAIGESIEQGTEALVGLKCDVLIGQGTEAVKLLRDASGEIPIVMAGVGDPVGAKLVDSLARPGGKVTGVSMIGHELFTKIVSLLSELAPRAKRVGLLTVASNPANEFFARTMAEATGSHGLTSKGPAGRRNRRPRASNPVR